MLTISPEFTAVVIRLIMAAILGSLIGFERSYHGRPAGLRTHALVCTASSLLMLFTVFQWELLQGIPIETIRVDPTRMAQGIMTGIGFLGAGVVLKEKLTIRGLTTATSIWITAAIGIIVGMGFFSAAAMGTVLTLIILTVFGGIERKFPTYTFSRLTVRCNRQDVIGRDALMELVRSHDFKASIPSYQLEDAGRCFRYMLTIHTKNPENLHALANSLLQHDDVTEFSIIPLGK
jgi:putative Mg2+ transporter-C (MgtC) family protein